MIITPSPNATPNNKILRQVSSPLHPNLTESSSPKISSKPLTRAAQATLNLEKLNNLKDLVSQKNIFDYQEPASDSILEDLEKHGDTRSRSKTLAYGLGAIDGVLPNQLSQSLDLSTGSRRRSSSFLSPQNSNIGISNTNNNNASNNVTYPTRERTFSSVSADEPTNFEYKSKSTVELLIKLFFEFVDFFYPRFGTRVYAYGACCFYLFLISITDFVNHVSSWFGVFVIFICIDMITISINHVTFYFIIDRMFKKHYDIAYRLHAFDGPLGTFLTVCIAPQCVKNFKAVKTFALWNNLITGLLIIIVCLCVKNWFSRTRYIHRLENKFSERIFKLETWNMILNDLSNTMPPRKRSYLKEGKIVYVERIERKKKETEEEPQNRLHQSTSTASIDNPADFGEYELQQQGNKSHKHHGVSEFLHKAAKVQQKVIDVFSELVDITSNYYDDLIEDVDIVDYMKKQYETKDSTNPNPVNRNVNVDNIKPIQALKNDDRYQNRIEFRKRKTFWELSARISSNFGALKIYTYRGIVKIHRKYQAKLFGKGLYNHLSRNGKQVIDHDVISQMIHKHLVHLYDIDSTNTTLHDDDTNQENCINQYPSFANPPPVNISPPEDTGKVVSRSRSSSSSTPSKVRKNSRVKFPKGSTNLGDYDMHILDIDYGETDYLNGNKNKSFADNNLPPTQYPFSSPSAQQNPNEFDIEACYKPATKIESKTSDEEIKITHHNIVEKNTISFLSQYQSKDSVTLLFEEALNLLDPFNLGYVTEEQCMAACLQVYKEMRFAASALNDYDELHQSLRTVIDFFFWTLMLFLLQGFLGLNIYSYILPFVTLILSISFALSSLLGNIFLSIAFVFFYMPFEIGNKIYIGYDPNTRITGFVRSVSLFHTTINTLRNEIMKIPNHVLFHEKICNLAENSGGTVYEMIIHFSIRNDSFKKKIEEVKEKLVREGKNIDDVELPPTIHQQIDHFWELIREYALVEKKHEWQAINIMCTGINAIENNIQYNVYVTHRDLWQDLTKANIARTMLYRKMQLLLDELGLTHVRITQKVELETSNGNYLDMNKKMN